MDDQEIFLKPNESQNDEILFYTEDHEAIYVKDFIVFDSNENSQNLTFENDTSNVSDNKEIVQTVNVPSTTSDQPKIKKSPKRWCQKEVMIKTIESEFKVVMWVLNDDNNQIEQVKTEPLSKPKQIDKKLELKSNLETPQISLLNAVPPSIKCTFKTCRILCKDAKTLREHLKENVPEHSNKLSYNCTFDKCSKIFKDISGLRKHLHTHGPKTKVCAECGKAFIDNSKLSRHLVVHTGDKPFKCFFEGCGKCFSLDFNLRTHARIHTGYRPYVCTFDGCNKTFAQSTNLKSHQIVHLKKIQAQNKH